MGKEEGLQITRIGYQLSHKGLSMDGALVGVGVT